jgi:hypothetical protein
MDAAASAPEYGTAHIEKEFGTDSGIILKNPLIVFEPQQSYDDTARKSRGKEVNTIDRKLWPINRSRTFILLSVIAIGVVLSGIYMTVYAAENGEELAPMPRWQWRNHERYRFRSQHGGPIEVSDEYEANVIAIAESDTDVQAFLDDGYSIIGVRPLLKRQVDANGDVTTSATNAVVMLENEEITSHVAVMVDLGEGHVTQIVIVTRTVIDKT